MSSKRDVLDEMVDQFKARLAENIKVVKLSDYGFETDEEWHFRPTTSAQGDVIAPILQSGKVNSAVIEIIFQRARTPDGERRFRTQRDRERLMRADPDTLSAIVMAINGFDDVTPDVEGARKNSNSTGTSEAESG